MSALTNAEYAETQKMIEVFCQALLGTLGDSLESFIRRAEYSMAIGPILHPSEFRAGAGNLSEVLTCAHALRDAREKIRKAAC